MEIDLFYVYLNTICAIGGICLFIYSSSIVSKILKMFPKAKIRKDWKIINVLIFFFIGGYGIGIISILLENIPLIISMQAMVYVFGAFFVFLVIRLSYKTYKIIIAASESENE
ncbi:MAG: hypothetical protein ACTSRG_16435 [Candidatus Helarchaeota archaeon]